MDQYPAQDTVPFDGAVSPNMDNGGIISPPSSPIKKILPFLIIVVVLLLLLLFVSVFTAGSKGKKNEVVLPTPTRRPTATPYNEAPTIPLVAPPTATPSSAAVSVTPVKLGRLAMIKNGDIYHSDIESYALLVKNNPPAGDRLSWSTNGKYLAWRPKSQTATPSAVTVSRVRNGTSPLVIRPNDQIGTEVYDYNWVSDDSLAVLYKSQDLFNVSLYTLASGSASEVKRLISRKEAIRQVSYMGNNQLLLRADEGILNLDIDNPAAKTLVTGSKVINMKLSPDKSKIVYAVGDVSKNDLYIVNTDGTGNKKINPMPGKVDMGTTGVSQTVLAKGFVNNFVWFPKSNRLIVGYHYIPGLPLSGIYDLDGESFTAVNPFPLFYTDLMVDEQRMLGVRIRNTDEGASWQLSLFTLEDNAKFGTIRVIPGVSAFSFYDREN